jgi:hypothetical protein
MARKTKAKSGNNTPQNLTKLDDTEKSFHISDEQFLSILRECGGLFAKTAAAISRQFGVKYTRQAAWSRAQNFPEEVMDIKEETKDIAEDGLISLMSSDNESIRLKAIETYLKTQARDRGYGDHAKVEHSGRLQQEQHVIDYSKLSAEALEEIVRAAESTPDE